MTTTKPANSMDPAALVGGVLLIVAVVAAAFYFIQVQTAPEAAPVVSQSHPTQVLETGFGPNGPFVKTGSLVNPTASAGGEAVVGVGSGDIGKTDITSFE